MGDLRWAIGIGLVAVALRLAPLAIPFDFTAAPDSPSYLEPAASLARGQGYLDGQGRPTAARPPGYSAFVAAVWTVAGPSPVAVQVAQALLGGVAALLAWVTLQALRAPRTLALGGALLLAVDPIAVGQSPYLLREALLLTLVAALVCALVALRGRARLAAGGAVLAALALTHQLYVLLGPALAAADLLERRRAGARALARRALAWAAVGLLVALPLALWARRNERATGRLSVVLTENAVPARELWLTVTCPNRWLNADRATGFQERAWAEEARLVAALGVEGTKRELYRRAWEQWRDHPARSLGRLALMNFWYWAEVPGAVSLVEHPRLFVARWALLPFHWVRLTCAAAGLLLVLRDPRWRPLRPVALGVLAFFALAPALLYPIPRYLAPACPLLDLLAALGLHDALSRRRA